MGYNDLKKNLPGFAGPYPEAATRTWRTSP
jgi:hypothetical protein